MSSRSSQIISPSIAKSGKQLNFALVANARDSRPSSVPGLTNLGAEAPTPPTGVAGLENMVGRELDR
jgi:hypothetical protein